MDRLLVKKLLHDMLLARAFEERAAREYTQGNIGGFLHLYPGEEAVAVGVVNATEPSDYLVATYREHVHALARGVPTGTVMAELFGRKGGISGGMGGSMHLFDAARRFMGGYAIVGETYPIAIGIAYAIALRELPETVVCFFGDGAANQGTFHESLNMTGLWRLPVLFVCENNRYQIGTEIHRHSAEPEIAHRARSYRIPAEQHSGQDVVEVYQTAQQALQRIRQGEGPQLLEYATYRFRGHSMADPGSYRPAVEVNAFKGNDPVAAAIRELEFGYPARDELEHNSADAIRLLCQYVGTERQLTKPEIETLRADVNAEIEAAVNFAAASPEPELADAYRACHGGLDDATLV